MVCSRQAFVAHTYSGLLRLVKLVSFPYGNTWEHFTLKKCLTKEFSSLGDCNKTLIIE